MKLSLSIAQEEIVRLAHEATPVRIDLGKKRSVSFGTPSLVELAPKKGLRIRGDARMVWEVAGLTLPVTLRRWQLLLVPSIARQNGALVLAFEPVIEDLDFNGVPGFFDERIVDAINEGVATQRNKLCWNLSRVLGVHRPLPARVSPSGALELAPVVATIEVTATGLFLEIELDASVVDQAVATPRSLRSA